MITRAGTPVADLRLVRLVLSAEVLLDRRRRLPEVDPVRLREDVDRLLDASL
jgi:hypothetical protein